MANGIRLGAANPMARRWGERAIMTSMNRVLLLGVLLLSACSASQRAAAKDPLKCERDPKCAQRNRVNDCTMQCSGDPECTRRCEEINLTIGVQQK